MAMIRHVDNDLNTLKNLLLSMGGQVEKSLALVSSNNKGPRETVLNQALEIEGKINELHLRVDEACLLILATQAPVAGDLRTVLAIHKINSDLERMGDQVYSTCLRLDQFKQETYQELPPQWNQMVEDVTWMVKNCLDAFSKLDVELSREVLAHDDKVDCHNTDLTGILKERMKKRSLEIDAAVEALAMVRNLERVADHATNITEEVIFIVTGDDIRHGGMQSV